MVSLGVVQERVKAQAQDAARLKLVRLTFTLTLMLILTPYGNRTLKPPMSPNPNPNPNRKKVVRLTLTQDKNQASYSDCFGSCASGAQAEAVGAAKVQPVANYDYDYYPQSRPYPNNA